MPSFERVQSAKRRSTSSTSTSVARTQPQSLAEVPQSKHHFGNLPIEPPATAAAAPVQAKSMAGDQAATAAAQQINNTGLPDQLKAGVENLSGFSLDNVRVHYNSYKPAKLQALAYTQGTDIHVAPGQEQHLAHEAWHVVQQARGRVKPTRQMKGGLPVNDDENLEHEAETRGKQAGHLGTPSVHGLGCGCSSCRQGTEQTADLPGPSSALTSSPIQLMCDKGHSYHPSGPCPFKSADDDVEEEEEDVNDFDDEEEYEQYSRKVAPSQKQIRAASQSEVGEYKRSGTKAQRDKWYGGFANNPEAQEWWHRTGKKQHGGKDITDAQTAKSLFEEFKKSKESKEKKQ